MVWKLSSRALLLIAVLAVCAACVTQSEPVIGKDFEIFGTWVNDEYDKPGPVWPPKVVVHPNGTTDVFVTSAATEPFTHGKVVLTSKWFDHDGNAFYTAILAIPVGWLLVRTVPLWGFQQLAERRV